MPTDESTAYGSKTSKRFLWPSSLVSVIWTEPREGTVRIVSARWATKRERRLYREEMDQER